jgi:PAS domain-containing protein
MLIRNMIHTQIQSGLYMPLKVGERVIGVISVESEAADAFTEQDERLLATLGSQAATAFENARLYQTIERELSERKRTEDALRSSEVHYRELADSITDILFELDEDLCYTHWNKASEVFSGISAEDAIGKSMKEIFEQRRNRPRGNPGGAPRTAATFETEVKARDKTSFKSMLIFREGSVVAKDTADRKRLRSS